MTPSTLVILGDVVEVELFDHKWQFLKNESWVTASTAGKQLYIIPKNNKLPRSKKASMRGVELFEKFHGWESDKNYAYKMSQKKFLLLGNAISITYDSDKWDGKKRGYIHHFDNLTIVSANSVTNPTIFKLTGSFWITKRGIEG